MDGAEKSLNQSIGDRVTAVGAAILCFSSALLGGAMIYVLFGPWKFAPAIEPDPGNAAEWLAAIAGVATAIVALYIAMIQRVWHTEEQQSSSRLALITVSHELFAAGRGLTYAARYCDDLGTSGKLPSKEAIAGFLRAIRLNEFSARRSDLMKLQDGLSEMVATALSAVDNAKRILYFNSSYEAQVWVYRTAVKQARDAVVPLAETVWTRLQGPKPNGFEAFALRNERLPSHWSSIDVSEVFPHGVMQPADPEGESAAP